MGWLTGTGHPGGRRVTGLSVRCHMPLWQCAVDEEQQQEATGRVKVGGEIGTGTKEDENRKKKRELHLQVEMGGKIRGSDKLLMRWVSQITGNTQGNDKELMSVDWKINHFLGYQCLLDIDKMIQLLCSRTKSTLPLHLLFYALSGNSSQCLSELNSHLICVEEELLLPIWSDQEKYQAGLK